MMNNSFGARLRAAREAAGLSLNAAIAQLTADGVKIAKSSLSAYENGVRRPMPDTIRALARLYRADERDLLAAASGFDSLPFTQPYAAPVYERVTIRDKKCYYENHIGDRIVDMQFLGDTPKSNLLWVIANDDSMAAAGIPRGAFALIDRTPADVRDDALVLAAVDDKPAFLCRLKRMEKEIALTRANPAIEPLYFLKKDQRRVNIIGRVKLVQVDFF